MRKFKILLPILALAVLCLGVFVGCDDHTHTLEHHVAKEATCTQTGNVEYWTCTGCEKRFSDADGKTELEGDPVLAVRAHALTAHAAAEASCTDDGNIAYWVCSTCNAYFTDAAGKNQTTAQAVVIPASHTLEYIEAVPESCTMDGSIEYWHCSVCAKCFKDEAATEELAETELVISAHPHSLTKTEANSQTCTEDGNIAYWHCSECSKNFSDEGHTELTGSYVIPADGHNTTHEVFAEATCEEDGNIEYWYCSVCKKYFEDEDYTQEITIADTVIPAGHSIVLCEAVAPTWAADGRSEDSYRCTKCGTWYADENGDEELDSETIRIARETAPTVGVKLDERAIPKSSSSSLNFYDSDTWVTFGDTNGYGGGSEKPVFVDDHLEFTSASRFEMLWIPLVNTYGHLGGGDGYWKQGTGSENGGDAVVYYGQQFLYTLTVSANGAFDLELFGMSGSQPDRTGQCGWFFHFEGDTVSLYMRVSTYDSTRNVLWATAELAGFNFASGEKYTVSFLISRDSFDDYTVSLYVNHYKAIFGLDGARKDEGFLAIEEGTIHVNDTQVHFGQRLSVIPQSIGETYATVSIYALDILKVDGFPVLPMEGEKLSTEEINGSLSFFDPENWAAFGSSSTYGGTNDKPTLVQGDDGNYLEFDGVASRFELLWVPVDGSYANLGDGNTWKESGNGGSARGQRYLYTMSVSASGAYDLEIFGLSGSSIILEGTDAQCGMFFRFNGDTVELYFRNNATDNKGGVVLWATAKLGETVTDGVQHDISFMISRSTRYYYTVVLYVDGVKANFVKDEARTETFFDISTNGLVLRGSGTISMGQRLSVIPRANAEGEYATVRIYSLEILKVGAVTPSEPEVILPEEEE